MSVRPASARFEAIVAEYYEALEEGRTTPHLPNLVETNPDLAHELRAFYEDQEAVQRRISPLRELVGSLPPMGLPRSVEATLPPQPLYSVASLPPTGLPRSVEGYLLGEVLGEGGMGVVVRAHDRVLGRTVAIKIMQASAKDRPDLAQRFVAEAQILGQLQHPYIVPLHQLGKLPDGRPFLVMKLVQGSTLSKLLGVRPADAKDLAEYIDRLLDVFGFICQAMAHAHNQGVLHRDLKPGNVMVGAHGEVQVMDWGLAKVRTGAAAKGPGKAVNAPGLDSTPWHSQTGDVLGTYAYMAPEQAAGKISELDEHCDVFGLGAILCQILTGAPPYVTKGHLTVMQLAREAKLEDAWQRLDRSIADAELKNLARQCLSKLPTDRPANAAVLAAEIEKYRTGRRELARKRELALAAAEARAKSERTRRRLSYGLTAAAVLLTGVSLVAAWFFVLQKERQIELDRVEIEAIVGVEQAMREADGLKTAWKKSPLDSLQRLAEDRVAVVLNAKKLAHALPPSHQLHQTVQTALTDAQAEITTFDKDRRLMARLLELLMLVGNEEYLRNPATGLVIAPKTINADQQLGAAFREWGLEPDQDATEKAAARIRSRPEAVATELIAGLDMWAFSRRQQKLATTARLLDLADAVDQPDDRRRELRQLLRATELDRKRLRDLAKDVKPANEASLTLLVLARALWDIGEFETLTSLLRAATTARPGDVLLRAHHGSFCLMRGTLAIYSTMRLDKAPEPVISADSATHFNEAVANFDALRAKRPETRLLWAMALLQTPRYKEGIDTIDDIQKTRQDDPLLHLMKATALMIKGHVFDAAKSASKAAKGLDPQNKDILTQTLLIEAMAAKEAQDWDKAEKLFAKAIQSTSDTKVVAVSQMGRGEALYHLGKIPDAIKAFGEASRILQAIPSGHVFLAQQSERVKDFESAKKLIWRGLQEDPDNAALLVYAIDFFRRQGMKTDADKLKQGLPLTKLPEDPPSMLKIAFDLQGLREFEMAEKAYRRFLQSAPDHFEATVNLTATLILMNKGRDAETLATKVVKARPDFYVGYFLHGWAFASQGRFADAEAPLRKAHGLKPDEASPALVLGYVLGQLTKTDEAEKLLREGLQLNPNDAPGHLWLSEVLRTQGKEAEAREMYNKGLKLQGGSNP